MTDDSLGSSTQYAIISSLSAVLPRILSFLFRGILIRHVGTEFLGIIFVRLELLSTSILFFSREMIRRAISSDSSFQKSVNLTWLFLPIGLIISTMLVSIWIYLDINASEETFNLQYPYACALIGFSSILQMFEEPVYYLGAKNLNAKNKSAAEASMLVSRSILYVVAALYGMEYYRIIIFATVHAISSLICSLIHWRLWYSDPSGPNMSKMFPKRDEDGWFDPSQLERLKAFFVQGFSKQVLTEGERFIVTFFNIFDLKHQGLWDSINALGALFPRFIFRPLEEGYFYFFRENPKTRRSKLPIILRMSLLLGLICLFVGTPQCFSILFLYGGKTLSDWPGEMILAVALLNTLFCACNGMIEAFLFSAMDECELKNHNWTLNLFSIIYIGLTALFGTYFGPIGITLAQVVNMTLRILHGIHFISRKHEEPFGTFFIQSSPQIQTWCALVLSFLLQVLSRVVLFNGTLSLYLKIALHGIIGIFSGVLVVAVIFKFEVEIIQNVLLQIPFIRSSVYKIREFLIKDKKED